MKLIDLQKAFLISSLSFLGAASPVFSGSIAGQSFKTSFDCTKARSEVERKICENKQLADADLEMASLYKSLLSGLPDYEKDQLKHEQLDWVKERNTSCSGSKTPLDCIGDSYRTRIETLKKREAGLQAAPPAAASGYPVKWFPGLDLQQNVPGEKAPQTVADVQRLLRSTWDDGFEVEGHKEKRTVKSCGDFFRAKKDNLYPQTNIDRGPYSAIGLYCYAAQLIVDAKPAKKSFIENLKLDRTIARYIPPDAEYIISDEQPRHTTGTWADVEKLKFEKIDKDNEIEYSSEDADHSVLPVAVGDFDHDGVQDILLLISHSVKEGTHFEKYLYLLTRFGPNAVLKTVKRYEALED